MRTRHTISVALTLTCCAGTALAQQDNTMPGSAERVRQAEAVLPRVVTNETPVMPTLALVSKAVEPGLTEGHDWTKALAETLDQRIVATTLAEGTFLLDRLGRLVRGPNDRLIFVPDHEQRQAGEGPMLILPSSMQDQLSQSWTGQPVLVRGEVFLYRGRNYLLVAWFSLVADEPDTPAETPTETTTETTTETADNSPVEEEPPASLEDDPQVQALLEELNADAHNTPSTPGKAHPDLSPNTSPPMQSQMASTASGIREGTILMRRRGRLERQTDGSWALVFDNDEAADLGAEALTILPCRMLMEMESLSARDGGVRELIVSGRVYASNGDGYLLPTLIQRVRPEGITPRQ